MSTTGTFQQCIDYVDISWHSATRGRQTREGWENKLFSSKMRQYHSPDGANCSCVTSNKSLTCLLLVFTSNWSNFWHAFALCGFGHHQLGFLIELFLHTHKQTNKQKRSHYPPVLSLYNTLIGQSVSQSCHPHCCSITRITFIGCCCPL